MVTVRCCEANGDGFPGSMFFSKMVLKVPFAFANTFPARLNVIISPSSPMRLLISVRNWIDSEDIKEQLQRSLRYQNHPKYPTNQKYQLHRSYRRNQKYR